MYIYVNVVEKHTPIHLGPGKDFVGMRQTQKTGRQKKVPHLNYK